MGSTTVQAPAPRNIAQETGDTLQTQIDLAPQQLAAYQQTAPGYAAADRATLWDSFTAPNGILSLNNMLADQTANANLSANRSQRVADLTDLNTYGGGMLTLQQSLNKQMYDSMNDYGNRAYAGVDTTGYANQAGQIAANGFGQYTPTAVGGVDANNAISGQDVGFNTVRGNGLSASAIQGQNVGADAIQGVGVGANTGFDAVRSRQGDMGLRMGQMQLASGETAPGQLQRGLEQQAAQGLALGGQLSGQETRDAQQAARAAFAARGLGSTNASVAAEVLNLDNAQRARLAERQQLAASVDAQGNAQRNQNFSNTLGLSNASQGYNQANIAAQQANLGAQMQGNSMGLQAGLANQQNAYQTQLANQQAGLQANLANQQNSYQTQLANQQAGLQAGQFTGQQDLQAQLANQAAGLQAGQLNQQNNYNAQLANQADAYQRAALNAQIGQFNAGQNQSAAGMNMQSLQNQYSALNSSDQNSLNRQYQNNQQLQNYVGMRQNTQFDPALGILGRQSINQGTTQGLFGQGAASVAGSNAATRDMFNPFNSYAADLYGSNQNMAYSASAATAGNKANMIGGLFSAAGSLGGAAILKCWVAREVYGFNNPRWLQFREWMLNKAPEALRIAYIENGERLAYALHNKPRLKAKIKAWMDAQLMEDAYAL